MPKIKILHIITSLGSGGAEKVLFNLVTNSDVDKFKHVVISLIGLDFYGDRLRDFGIKVYPLHVSKNNLFAILKVFGILNQERPAVIQSWLYHADLVSVLARFLGYQNIIWNIRNNRLVWNKSSKLTILIRKICAWLSFIPVKIICCADAAKHEHVKVGYMNSKFKLINNGYDLSQYVFNNEIRIELRKELNIRCNEVVVGNVGRFDPAKDHLNLLNALGILKNRGKIFKVVLIGKNINSNNNELVGWVNHYQLQDVVILLDERRDVPNLYNIMDVFVLSSETEGFPNVVAEAMASELPCVVTDVGDAAKIVGDTGVVVPIKNANALADGIEQLLNLDAATLSEYGLKARQLVENNYSLPIMVKKYEKLYESLL